MSITVSQGLNLEQLKSQLDNDGLAGPIDLADVSRLDEACEVIVGLKAKRREQLQRLRESGKSLESATNPLIDRHMDVDVLTDLFFDQSVQTCIKELFGEDLFVWRSNFFVKSDGTGENKWHHDRHFENGCESIRIYDTSNHFTVTIALTDIGMNQGRLEFIKGSHLPIEGFDRDIPRHFVETPEVIASRVTPMPLRRGQFVLLHSSLLHRSLAFGSGERRISMAARIARSGTAIPAYGSTNPAGGAQSQAEPNVYYRESGIMPLN